MLHRWVDRVPDFTWSVAVTTCRDTTTILRAYGAEHTAPQHLTYAQARCRRMKHFDKHGFIQIRRRSHHAVIFEPNGWASIDDDLARRLSTNSGHYITAYWSPTAHLVVEAIDGIITARFDPLYVDGNGPQRGEVYPLWLHDDAYHDDSRLRSSSLSLIKQRTGIRIAPRWLHAPLPTYPIPAP